jgi:2-deoxy-D-gluconate 3-dehydrogenase
VFDLSGKVAIVTGGDGGIGLGMARGLARAGASLVLAARNPEKSALAVAELQALGAEVIAIETDVTSDRSITALIDQAVTHFGRLDVLVNNSGMNVRLPAQELTLEQWHQVLDTNLTGAFLCAKAAYPYLRGGGKVINVGSMLSLFGSAVAAAYGASKGGVVQLTKSLAVGWAADGIQVNAILPGWIDTALTRTAREQLPGLNERVLARSPSGRWGVPADFEGIAVFLASEASNFITGAAIPVDGGYSSEV